MVQRPVWLHVGHLAAGDLSEGVEGAELVEHAVAQIVGVHVDEAAPEPGDVGIADLGADGDVAFGGELARAAHRGRRRRRGIHRRRWRW